MRDLTRADRVLNKTFFQGSDSVQTVNVFLSIKTREVHQGDCVK